MQRQQAVERGTGERLIRRAEIDAPDRKAFEDL
jgi:hypothetical protein